MKKSIVFLVLMLIVLTSIRMKVQEYIPNGWPKPFYSYEKYPLQQAQVNLGKALFYDNILSKDSSISCSSCHLSYTAFTHVDHDLSHGIYDRIGKRNAPALMNLAWSQYMMWDGAINHIEMQALAPIHDTTEMAETIEHVVDKLNRSTLYKKLFYTAYQDSIATGEKTLKSIAQFLRTLISANAKYDQVKRGETAFTAQEQQGYVLYQQHCANCHQEPLFSTYQFANNGLPQDSTLKDIGRANITKRTEDSFKFKIPTLRNIEYSFPYMHDGRFKTLQEVLKHYTLGIQTSSTLDASLRTPIALTSNQKVDLIAFLLTLSDKEFLFNPAHQYPKEIFGVKPK